MDDLGFMSWLHAWRTFSRASWVRMVKIYARIFATIILIEFVVGALIIAQTLVYVLVMQASGAH
jgi:hypothetical protein